MPEIAVILDLDEYLALQPENRPKNLRSSYWSLTASCPICQKPLGDGNATGSFILGTARNKNGDAWEGGAFAKDGFLDYEQKTVYNLFCNNYMWGREGFLCACSKTCAKTLEADFRERHSGTTLTYTCQACGKSGADKRCGKCKAVWYCSLPCQKHDWKSHKTSCGAANGKVDTQNRNAARNEKVGENNEGTDEKRLKCGGCQLLRKESEYTKAQLKKKGKRKCVSCSA